MRGASLQEPAGRYDVEFAVMRYMRWSWRELMDAPSDLVDEIVARISAESRWMAEKQKQQDAMNQQLASRGLGNR